jgi:hypothetical protein
MDAEHHDADSHRLSRLAEKTRRKAYRDSYVASHTRQFLARQMREMRGDRSQTEFGVVLDKQQTVVSRLEDPNYGKWTLQTLFDVARKQDIAVIVRFVDYPTFFRITSDRTKSTLSPAPYDPAKVDELVQGREGESQSLEAFEKIQKDTLKKNLPDQSLAAKPPPPANENAGGNAGLFAEQR